MSDGALVLIIEDNPRNLKLARDTLNHNGYETLEAENAADGLGLARARRRSSSSTIFLKTCGCSSRSSPHAATAWSRRTGDGRRSSTWPRSRWTSCCWTS